MPRDDSERRSQLAEFLKYMRAQVSPEDAGFPRGPRRRTPGLRREEVAELIGVGPVWYAWLEQGRAITPSAQVVSRLALALKLSGDQIAYLFRLARPQAAPDNPDQRATVPARIADMIRSFEYQPAYVRNLRMDILDQNDAHAKVFGDYSSIPIERRNILWLLFMDPSIRALTLNWEIVAQQVTAKFRADLSRNPEDKHADRLVNELLARSPEFARWWKQYRTKEVLTHPVELEHPIAGRITLERVTLRIESELTQNVIVYMPLDAQSTKRLKALCVETNRRLARPPRRKK